MCAAFGDYRLVLLGMAITGCSAGLLLPTVSGLVLASAPAHRRGRFTGVAAAMRPCATLGGQGRRDGRLHLPYGRV